MNLKLWFLLGPILLGSIIASGAALWIYTIDRKWSPIIEPRVRERQNLNSIRILAEELDPHTRGTRNTWLGSFSSGRQEDRHYLSLDYIPTQLVQAIVVLEDARFLDHEGFDLRGILRAALNTLKTLRFTQGGSTITQQLVKNIFLSPERTLKRKFTEIVIAALLEKRFSKDEILEAYLNEVYLGQMGQIQIQGVSTGAEFWLGKKINQLTLAENALLAGIIAGPGFYSPTRHPDRSRARRDRVLRLMLEHGFILEKEFLLAQEAELPGPTNYASRTRVPYLMDALQRKLSEEFDEATLISQGFEITLGLDLSLQNLASTQLLGFSQKYPELQALIIAADPQSCTIKAYAGGTNYQITQLDRITQSSRPVGSMLKPLALVELLEHDPTLSLHSALEDRPLEWSFDKGRQKWQPSNYDRKFRGDVSLRETLEQSYNVPFLRVFFDRFSSLDSFHELFDPLRAYGLKIPNPSFPSFLLGSIEQRPWDLMQAYLKFARQAMALAHDAADFSCELSFEKKNNHPNFLFEETVGQFRHRGARLAMAALEGAIRRGTSQSLGSQLPLDQEWAGKTGTSSDLSDSWFVALSPQLVVLSWVGSDKPTNTGLTGSQGALPLQRPLVIHQSTVAGSSGNEAGAKMRWPTHELEWALFDTQRKCRLKPALFESSPHSTTPPPLALSDRPVIWELIRSDQSFEFCNH